MTFDDLLITAPAVINELAAEFVRRGDECLKADKTSQLTACMFLALRSVSLLCGMAPLLQPARLDSCDVLVRSLLESTDLLMHFRFDDEGTRKKIEYWFAGKADNAWKAEHNKCEEFMRRLGHGESQLAPRWSAMTALSHPTVYAAQNSAKNVAGWVAGLAKRESVAEAMELKIADYLTSISKLIVVATFDLPGWVPLGFDLSRMPTTGRFQRECKAAIGSIQAKHQKITLPEDSYRADSGKSTKRAELRKNRLA
jgi:hypothetical protein